MGNHWTYWTHNPRPDPRWPPGLCDLRVFYLSSNVLSPQGASQDQDEAASDHTRKICLQTTQDGNERLGVVLGVCGNMGNPSTRTLQQKILTLKPAWATWGDYASKGKVKEEGEREEGIEE